MPISAATAPSADELIAQAEALIPTLLDRAAGDEQAGHVAAESIDAVRRLGLMKMAQPLRWGGFESPLTAVAQVVMNLARGDHAVGWVHGLFSLHAHHLALFDDRAQRDVWGEEPDTVIASSYSPTGKARSVAGGFEVKGHWPFSSGCDFGDWFMLGACIDGDPNAFNTFLIPARDVRIVDDWKVMGLKATGSKTVTVDSTFVPAHRVVPFGPASERFAFPGLAVNTAPRFRVPYLVIFNRCVTACSIGSLQAMIDATVDYTLPKVSIVSGQAVAGHPDTLHALGQAAATLNELKILAMHDLIEMERQAAAGERPSEADINFFRYRAQEAGARCAAAGRELFEAAGGGALYEHRSLSRIYRNLIGARNHPATAVFRDTLRAIGSAQYVKEVAI